MSETKPAAGKPAIVDGVAIASLLVAKLLKCAAAAAEWLTPVRKCGGGNPAWCKTDGFRVGNGYEKVGTETSSPGCHSWLG